MAQGKSAEHASAEGDVPARLLAAAGPVFAEQGFDRATVREICSAAGVNVASVAYYFGDKMGLYREVIEAIRQSRERRFPAPADEDVDVEVMMYRLVNTMLSRMLAGDSSGWESQLLMRECQQPTPVFESIVKNFFRPLYNTLTRTTRRLLGAEAADHQVDQLALSVVGQCVYYRFGDGVVQILIPKATRQQHFDIDSLSLHITSVTIASTCDRTLSQVQADLQQRLEAVAIGNSEHSNESHLGQP